MKTPAAEIPVEPLISVCGCSLWALLSQLPGRCVLVYLDSCPSMLCDLISC